MAGYSVNCSVKPVRDDVKSREGGGGQKAVVRYHDSELRHREYEFSV